MSEDTVRETGLRWERRAEAFLSQQGLTLVARNFRAPRGEIDLVMQEARHLVFVEVRYRARSRHGNALGSVTPAKQRKLRQSATTFLQRYPSWKNHPCRFDVIAYDGAVTRQYPVWIRAAFE